MHMLVHAYTVMNFTDGCAGIFNSNVFQSWTLEVILKYMKVIRHIAIHSFTLHIKSYQNISQQNWHHHNEDNPQNIGHSWIGDFLHCSCIPIKILVEDVIKVKLPRGHCDHFE